jgi:hypothetical protein
VFWRGLVAAALAAVAILVALGPPGWDAPPGGDSGVSGVAGETDEAGRAQAARNGAETADSPLVAGSPAEPSHRVEAQAVVRAALVLQVDEIDQCIEAAGTSLVIEAAGESFTAIVGEDGGALFEEVAIPAAGREFQLTTSVPDRLCFPASFRVAPADLDGEPPSFGLSIALIHHHALAGRVLDAATGAPLRGASVRVDSFAGSTATVDAEGRYLLALPEPRGTIEVKAPGYQDELFSFPERRPDGTTWLASERDFALRRDPLRAVLEIAVSTASGAPASHAELGYVEGSDAPYLEALDRSLPADGQLEFLGRRALEIAAFGRVVGVDGELPPTALDAQGTTTLVALLPMALEIVVAAGDEVAKAMVVLEPGATRQLDLSLAPGPAGAAALAVRSARATRVGAEPRELPSLPIVRETWRTGAVATVRGRAVHSLARSAVALAPLEGELRPGPESSSVLERFRVTTDRDGRFERGGLPGGAILRVRTRSGLLGFDATFELPERGEIDVDLLLRPLRRIIVVDAVASDEDGRLERFSLYVPCGVETSVPVRVVGQPEGGMRLGDRSDVYPALYSSRALGW